MGDIASLLNRNLVHCQVAAADKNELLKKMSTAMHEQGYVKEGYIEGVLAREAASPTGLQLEVYGCAIPHSEMSYVNKPVISVATLSNAVTFNRMDDFKAVVDVRLVFMLAVDEGLKQVNTLQTLMLLLQDNEKVAELVQATNSDEILNVFDTLEKAGK